MTGVEAVSNGVMAFRDDTRKNAKITLTIIIAPAGHSAGRHCAAVPRLRHRRHRPGKPGLRERALHADARRDGPWMVLLPHDCVRCLLVLALSANTAFADFPALTRAIALDDYMPHIFLIRGRRLLYSWGIYVLVALTALLLIIFGGVTDRLIPLYAIGAFMAFTLSQAGMVMHWKRKGGRPGRMFVNGLAPWPPASPTLSCWWPSLLRARGSRRC